MSQTVGQKVRAWFIPIGIVVIAGLLITLVVMQARGGGQGSVDPSAGGAAGATQQEQIDLTEFEVRDEADVQAMGSVDAPVTLVVYSDYQCPFCAKWTEETLPEMETYAKMGDLRIEWRDVNQYGADSERAAYAAHAAGLQDAFWEYHSALFPDGDHLPPEKLTEAALVDLASDLDLDTEQFTNDMNAEETHTQIEQYANVGRDLGVSGTPTFILGGEPLVGAQPPNVFVDTLTEKLAEARQ